MKIEHEMERYIDYCVEIRNSNYLTITSIIVLLGIVMLSLFILLIPELTLLFFVMQIVLLKLLSMARDLSDWNFDAVYMAYLHYNQEKV